MLKKLTLFALVAAFSVSLVACDDDEAEELEPVGNYEAVEGLDESAAEEAEERDDDDDAVDQVLDD